MLEVHQLFICFSASLNKFFYVSLTLFSCCCSSLSVCGGRKGLHLYLSSSSIQTHTERAQQRPRCSVKQIRQGRIVVIIRSAHKHTHALHTHTHKHATDGLTESEMSFLDFHIRVPEGIHKQKARIVSCKHLQRTSTQPFLKKKIKLRRSLYFLFHLYETLQQWWKKCGDILQL